MSATFLIFQTMLWEDCYWMAITLLVCSRFQTETVFNAWSPMSTPYNPSHGLIINVSGTDLTCGDPSLLVYYEDGAVDTQTLMQQCRYRENGESSVEGVTTSCSFVCAGKYPLEWLTVIFWQVEMMPWEPHTIPQYRICEINSEIYIPDIWMPFYCRHCNVACVRLK